MPRKLEDSKPKCLGGRSFGCRREPHTIGKVPDILCWRCKARMGCSACVEPVRDRVCLTCRDWATKTALAIHGPMVKQAVFPDAMKIVHMRHEGRVTDQEAEQLFAELWKLN